MGEPLSSRQLLHNSYHLSIRSSIQAIQTTLLAQTIMLQSQHTTLTDIKSTVTFQNATLQRITKTLAETFPKISSYKPPLPQPRSTPSATVTAGPPRQMAPTTTTAAGTISVALPTSTTATPHIADLLLTPSCCLASPTQSHVITARSTSLSSPSVHIRTDAASPALTFCTPSVHLPLFSNPPHLNSSTLPLDSYSSSSTPTVILPGSPPPTALAALKPSFPPPTTTSTTHLPTTPSSPILSFHQTPPAQCSTLAAGKVAVKETDSSVALDSDLAVVNASEAHPMIQSISKSLASVGKLTKQATASTQQPHLLPSIHVDKHSNPNTILNFAIDNPKHQQIASDISNNLNKPFRPNFAFPSPKKLLEKLTMDLERSNLVDRVSEHTAFLNWENKSFCFQKNEELLDDNWLWFLFISESPIMKSPVDNYVPLLQKGLHSCTTLIDPSAGILILKINRDKRQCESKILIFDPGGTTDRTSSFDLEDKVDFKGSVMIRLYITTHLTTGCYRLAAATRPKRDIKIPDHYKE